MRRILLNYARMRRAGKRGGDPAPVALEDADLILPENSLDDLLALDEALERLRQFNPRGADVVLYRDILERRRRHLGPRHPSVAANATLLANALTTLGQNAEAEQLLEEAVSIQREAMRREHRVSTLRVLGVVRARTGRYQEALVAFTEALAVMRALVGEDHREIAILLKQSAGAHERLARLDTAEREFRQAVRVADRALGANHSVAIEMRLSLIEFLIRRARLAEGRQLAAAVERALEAARIGSEDPLRQRLERALAAVAGERR
jgi:tetratricopeptide (TPR) repeat protein